MPALYQLPTGDFHDITSGTNGYNAGPGYDLVTGRGTPIANLIVPALARFVPVGSTTTAVSATPNPSPFAQTVMLTATLTWNGINSVLPTGTPTGLVTFLDGGTSLGSGPLNAGGTAFLAVSTLAAGTHTITAVYGGDTNFGGSTSAAFNQTITPSTTATLTSNANPARLGQNVTFTAMVIRSSSVPTGTVTFQDGSTAIGTACLSSPGPNSSPTAALKRAISPAGCCRATPKLP